MRLLRLAEGDLPKDGTDYLRLKAIEALGRLRTAGAESILRKIAEGRRAFRWASPSELRLVASQSMIKIDPEWVRHFVPRSGLSVAEFSIEPLEADDLERLAQAWRRSSSQAQARREAAWDRSGATTWTWLSPRARLMAT